MTEQIQEQVSAFADDELSAQECEFLVRRMERDPAFRQKALSYVTIGAALRGDMLNPDPDILRRRVQTELGGVPAPTRAEHPRPVLPSRFARPAIGFGVAAAVAAVALLALGSLTQPTTPSRSSGLLAGDVSTVPVAERSSYVVPQPVSVSDQPTHQPLAVPIRLTNYLVTHGEYVPGLGRTSIHTNVVGNQGTFVVVSTETERN